MNSSIDIVLCVVPGIAVKDITLGPAVLKGYLIEAGISSTILDFNLKFYQQFEERLNDFWGYIVTKDETSYNDCDLLYKDFNANCVDEILSFNPKYVGINVFSHQSQKAARLLAEEIRKRKTSTKIILGGQGIASIGHAGQADFSADLLEKNVIDYYIRGAGEIALVELIRGNVEDQVNTEEFVSIDDDIIKSAVYPNFDDYNIELYDHHMLPIISSRGCVRKCSFCDVHMTSKYQYRSGENVFEEMVHWSKKHNVHQFNFTDSLVNGNLKEFMVMLRLLAEHNKTNTPITWVGQYIIRAKKLLPADYWDLLEKSAGILSIGIETGSDRVRDHMNKNFTNEDIDYTLEECHKRNIKIDALFIVGYPSETLEDFEETINFFTKYQKYAGSTITSVILGNGLTILPNTPLMANADKWHIDVDYKALDNWIASDNPSLDIRERVRRVKVLHKHVSDLGFNITSRVAEIERLEKEIPYYEKRNAVRKIIKLKMANDK